MSVSTERMREIKRILDRDKPMLKKLAAKRKPSGSDSMTIRQLTGRISELELELKGGK